MRAGNTVLMQFPDSSVVPVPVRDIAAARGAGATLAKRNPIRPMWQAALSPEAMDLAPTAGSIVGSTVGGAVGAGVGGPPGAFAGRNIGGVLGGTLGKGAQEVGYRAQGLGDAPGTLADEAKFQAVAGLGGEAAGGVIGGIGRGAIRAGLPAKMAEAGKAVSQMVRHRVPIGGVKVFSGQAAKTPVIGPMLAKGSEEATKVWTDATAKRAAGNLAAEATGIKVPRQAAEEALEKLIKDYTAEMGDDAEIRYFQRVLDSWRRRKGEWLAPTETQAIITKFNNLSKPVHKAAKAGRSIPEDALQQKAAQRMAIAERLSDEMFLRVPGWGEQTAELSKAIVMKDAVKAAEHQGLMSLGSRLAAGSAVGSAIDFARGERSPLDLMRSGAIGGAALASPALLSRAGLLANDPLMQWMLRNAPRAIPSEGR